MSYPKTLTFARKESRIFDCLLTYRILVDNEAEEMKYNHLYDTKQELPLKDTSEVECNHIQNIKSSLFFRVFTDETKELVIHEFTDEDIISHIAKGFAFEYFTADGFRPEDFVKTRRYKEKYDEFREKISGFVKNFIVPPIGNDQ